MRSLAWPLLTAILASCGGTPAANETPAATPIVTSPAATLTPAPLPTPPPTCDQLTVLPLALSDIVAITPLGNLNPSGHVFPTNHVYFYTPRAATGTDARPVPVTSPGALSVSRVTTQEYRSATPIYTDYKLDFSICQPITGDIAHLGTVSDRILAELKKASPHCQEYATGGTAVRSCTYETKIELAPGERIGMTSAKSNALDLGAQDSRVRNAFVAPDRYFPEFSNAVCPIDLFAQPVFGQLRGKLGREASPKPQPRTIEPVCGTVMQDITGTAQGNWFAFPGRLTQEDPHLALVHDNVDPRQPIFSVGTSIPGLSAATHPYTVRDTGLVNRDFFQIRADTKVYCFEGLGVRTSAAMRILLTMPSERELRIEAQPTAECGAGPWTLGSKAVRFER